MDRVGSTYSITVLVFISSLICIPVTAERYVAADASGMGDGSYANPWTLSDALNQTLPDGEEILVNGSLSTAYTGPFSIHNKTILIGYNGTPHITSAGSAAFTIFNATIIENLEISKKSSDLTPIYGFTLAPGASYIRLSNISLHNFLSLGIYCPSGNHYTNVSLHNLSIYQNSNAGMALSSIDNLILDTATVVSNTGGGLSLSNVQNFSLSSITANDNSITSVKRPGLSVKDSSSGSISNFTAIGNSGGGMYLNNSSNVIISDTKLADQIGGYDFYTDSFSDGISLNNIRIGDEKGMNLSAFNLTGSYTLTTAPVTPAALVSTVSLDTYANISREDSGWFDSFSIHYSLSDLPVEYPEENIRILATNGSTWYPVSGALHMSEHLVSIQNPDEIRDGTWIYGLFTSNTVPTIQGISPSYGNRGETNKEISLSGSGFIQGSLVNLSNGTVNLTNKSETLVVNDTFLTTTFDLSQLVSDNYTVRIKSPYLVESIESVPFPVYDQQCPEVFANFSSDITEGTAPLNVSFTNSSTGGDIVRLVWQYGDSSLNSSESAPVHTFANPGMYQVNLTALNSCGNFATANHTITVTPPGAVPTVTNITPSTGLNTSSVTITNLAGTNFTSGAVVNLTRTGYPPINGTDVSVISPMQIWCTLPITGVATGFWNVTVTNPDSKTGQLVNGFTVTSGLCPSVSTSFTTNVSNGTVPLSVLFTDTSSGGTITNRSWSFGDGTSTSSLQNFVHTFEQVGNYSVTLETENDCGNGGNISHAIIVSQTPVPDSYTINASAGLGGAIIPSGNVVVESGYGKVFNISPDSGYNRTEVVVDGVNQGAVSSYPFSNVTTNHWIYASFEISTGNYTIHATASPGGTLSPSGYVVVPLGGDQVFTLSPSTGYSVSDVMVDGERKGAVDSFSFINVSSNHAIYANFTRIPGEYLINSSANEWGKIIPAGDNLYPEYSNQSFSMQAKPGSFLEHVTINSEAKGPVGSWTFTNLSADQSIYAESSPIPGQIQVLFNATPRWGAAPLDVMFRDQSYGDPISYYWQFGDGINSTLPNPLHRYNLSGVYSVTLRASNDKTGGVCSWNRLITVTDGFVPEPTETPVPGKINPSFMADLVNGTAPLSVQFTDTSSGNPIIWTWDFGDGSVSGDPHPSHQYTTAGSYSVTLFVQNRDFSGSIGIPNLVTVR